MKFEKFVFKKVELWLVLLIIILMILGSIFFGSLVLSNQKKLKFIFNSDLASNIANIPIQIYDTLTSEKSIKKQVKEAITPTGFMSKEQRFGKKDGVIFDKKFKDKKIVVIPHFCRAKREWCVELFDLETHKTKKIFVGENIKKAIIEERPKKIEYADPMVAAPFSVRFNYDGDMTFISAAGLIMQVNTKGETNWVKSDFYYHHTFNFSKDKSIIWAIGYDINNKSYLDPMYQYDNLKNDLIIKLHAKTGKVLGVFSILNALIDANLHNYLFVGRADNSFPDPMHINDVQPVLKKSKYFEPTDIFVSLGHANMALLYDTDSKKIKWSETRNLFHQHDIDIISNNSIAIFNNNRIITDSDKVFKHNEILKYNFETEKFTNLFQDEMKKNDIRTVNQGVFDIIGNLFFVEENNSGRILIFNKKNIIFEYYSKSEDNFPIGTSWSYIEDNVNVVDKLRESI